MNLVTRLELRKKVLYAPAKVSLEEHVAEIWSTAVAEISIYGWC